MFAPNAPSKVGGSLWGITDIGRHNDKTNFQHIVPRLKKFDRNISLFSNLRYDCATRQLDKREAANEA
jgi:hypothetical protein